MWRGIPSDRHIPLHQGVSTCGGRSGDTSAPHTLLQGVSTSGGISGDTSAPHTITSRCVHMWRYIWWYICSTYHYFKVCPSVEVYLVIYLLHIPLLQGVLTCGDMSGDTSAPHTITSRCVHMWSYIWWYICPTYHYFKVCSHVEVYLVIHLLHIPLLQGVSTCGGMSGDTSAPHTISSRCAHMWRYVWWYICPTYHYFKVCSHVEVCLAIHLPHIPLLQDVLVS